MATIVTGVVLFALVAFALIITRRVKKKRGALGCSGCSGCAGCAGCSGCPSGIPNGE
jgi:hypothetical protein